ncbi:MAG: chemotaxis protein CheW [Syntrophales bacterium]|jgi:purine-binding chemotaxis protein CheW|nr:chemotaxis protein CheW [Syntrophales bacterium]
MSNETTGGTNKSDLILDGIMRRKEKERIVDVEEKKVKVVIFSLHGDFYAFYGEHIKEILPLLTIYYVPGSPEFIPGVINVRGEIESVININRFLGLPDSENSPTSRIALTVTDGIRSGILVDSIEEVLDIPASLVNPPLDTLSKSIKEFVSGEFTHKGKLVTILDIGKIFGKINL